MQAYLSEKSRQGFDSFLELSRIWLSWLKPRHQTVEREDQQVNDEHSGRDIHLTEMVLCQSSFVAKQNIDKMVAVVHEMERFVIMNLKPPTWVTSVTSEPDLHTAYSRIMVLFSGAIVYLKQTLSTDPDYLSAIDHPLDAIVSSMLSHRRRSVPLCIFRVLMEMRYNPNQRARGE